MKQDNKITLTDEQTERVLNGLGDWIMEVHDKLPDDQDLTLGQVESAYLFTNVLSPDGSADAYDVAESAAQVLLLDAISTLQHHEEAGGGPNIALVFRNHIIGELQQNETALLVEATDRAEEARDWAEEEDLVDDDSEDDLSDHDYGKQHEDAIETDAPSDGPTETKLSDIDWGEWESDMMDEISEGDY